MEWQRSRWCCTGMQLGMLLSVLLSVLFGVLGMSATPTWAWTAQDFSHKRLAGYQFVPPQRPADLSAQTVIGAAQVYTLQRKDTFLDLARLFDLGYNELADLYTDMDPWAPPAGQAVRLPTSWILPQAPYQGIVVNIPEMRLYYFSQTKSGMPRRMVVTAPVGIGRPSWQTPEATFTVREKTENPTWVIPASIRKERIQKKGWSEQMIPGGVLENPLGKYRLRLSLASYAIHDTTNPWTIGRATTHGCVRLYPEDIAQLFPSIPVGTRGTFVYQPVKVGVRDQRIYVEVHTDVYGRVPNLWAEAQRVVEQSGFAEVVDPVRLAEAVHEQAGFPIDVTRTRDGLPAG